MMQKHKPAVVFHPGEFIAEELAARNQEPSVLRCRNWGDAEIEYLLLGELPVDPFLAMHLRRTWGVSEQFWLNLQGAWDAWPDRQSPVPRAREK